MTDMATLARASGAVALNVFAYPITMTSISAGSLSADGTVNVGTTTTSTIRGVITTHRHSQQPGSFASGYWPEDGLTLYVIDCDVDSLCEAQCFEPTCGPFEGERFELFHVGDKPLWQRHGVGNVVQLALRPVCEAS